MRGACLAANVREGAALLSRYQALERAVALSRPSPAHTPNGCPMHCLLLTPRALLPHGGHWVLPHRETLSMSSTESATDFANAVLHGTLILQACVRVRGVSRAAVMQGTVASNALSFTVVLDPPERPEVVERQEAWGVRTPPEPFLPSRFEANAQCQSVYPRSGASSSARGHRLCIAAGTGGEGALTGLSRVQQVVPLVLRPEGTVAPPV